jgi:hypothetical protein
MRKDFKNKADRRDLEFEYVATVVEGNNNSMLDELERA